MLLRVLELLEVPGYYANGYSFTFLAAAARVGAEPSVPIVEVRPSDRFACGETSDYADGSAFLPCDWELSIDVANVRGDVAERFQWRAAEGVFTRLRALRLPLILGNEDMSQVVADFVPGRDPQTRRFPPGTSAYAGNRDTWWDPVLNADLTVSEWRWPDVPTVAPPSAVPASCDVIGVGPALFARGASLAVLPAALDPDRPRPLAPCAVMYEPAAAPSRLGSTLAAALDCSARASQQERDNRAVMPWLVNLSKKSNIEQLTEAMNWVRLDSDGARLRLSAVESTAQAFVGEPDVLLRGDNRELFSVDLPGDATELARVTRSALDLAARQRDRE